MLELVLEDFSHRIDTGGPISLSLSEGLARAWQPPGEARKLQLVTHSCTAPECPCLETEIKVLEQATGVSASVMFEPATKRIVAQRDPSGLLVGHFGEWFEAELAGTAGDYIAARARRVKLRERPQPWRVRDWSSHIRGDMVTYVEAIPGDFDLVAEIDGNTYWARDMYCVTPGCECQQVAIEFHACGAEASARGGATLFARIDLLTGQVIEAHHAIVPRAFESLRRTYSIDELRYRYSRMREMARDVGPRFGRASSAPVVAEATVDRNARCPCGSGKKFKKCCGAPGRAVRSSG